MENFSYLLFQPLREAWQGFVGMVPNLLAMAVIIAAGLVAARVIRYLAVKLLGVLHFDTVSEKAGFTGILRKADVKKDPSEVAAWAVYWSLVVVVVMVGLGALRLETIDTLTSLFFNYLPRLLSAVVILAVGYTIAGFLGRAALISAVNCGYHYAKIMAEAVRILLIVLTVAMALEQLNIAPGIVVAAFSIVFGGMVLALAIAFGLAGVDTARDIIGKNSGKEEDTRAQGRDMEHL